MSVFTIVRLVALTLMLALSSGLAAQGNLEINTPAISTLQSSMQKRHADLAPLYASGAVGLARDGTVVLRDASSVPLAQRGQVNALVAAENADRAALYREIARANNRPDWEPDVRRTFAQRWIDRAQRGWWVEGPGGWTQK